MQGVPASFHDERDRAQFRHLPQLDGVELYHAHITKYAFEPHTHEAFGIGAITLGAERFRYRGEQLVAPVNSLVLMNPDELHTGESASEHGWQYRMIYLEPDFLESLTGEHNWWFNSAVNHHVSGAQRVARLIGELWQASDTLTQQGLLLNLVDTFRPYACHSPGKAPDAAHRFMRVREYLYDNYMHNITLDQLAAQVCLSPYHFQRQFKAHYHVTPHQMLMAIRLWYAKQFLTRGIPAAEVAARCRLTDQAHLTRAFTLRYGITPVRYQKQVRSR
ncbi:AraC family transcriptional regulator [Citrobacter sp. JGM124]|uniref:AraC family transcriptional regulator n=1 Tax=Citrobacter sp. JGM124 TaxID=2799789 RepID=UPI001BA9E4C4|nr:AraC family transcriptional regulator [Citrobacter sp. JGM124]